MPEERTPLFTTASLPPLSPQTACPPPPAPAGAHSHPWCPSRGNGTLARAGQTPAPVSGERAPARSTTVPTSVVAQAQQQATVKPLGLHTAHGQSAMVRYRYQEGKLYEVYGAPDRPTYLQLPPGERLAAPLAINTDGATPNAWAVGWAEQRKDLPDRQEVIALRPLGSGYETTSALLFQSGLSIFLKLVATQTAMVSVSWDTPSPALAAKAPEVPLVPRPPKIDVERLHTGYQVRPRAVSRPPGCRSVSSTMGRARISSSRKP